nr:hypothetical protein [uncultured Oscillibacter sp.]
MTDFEKEVLEFVRWRKKIWGRPSWVDVVLFAVLVVNALVVLFCEWF